MVTMIDVLAFIEKAMERKLDIQTKIFESQVDIWISNYEDRILICLHDNKLYIDFRGYDANSISLKELSSEDILRFRMLALTVEQYSNDKSEEMFRNFFNDEVKPLNINDLDDE